MKKIEHETVQCHIKDALDEIDKILIECKNQCLEVGDLEGAMGILSIC